MRLSYYFSPRGFVKIQQADPKFTRTIIALMKTCTIVAYMLQ